MARTALGKGRRALFSEEDALALDKPENVSRETSKVRISLVEPNRSQPRKEFDAAALAELADSIRKYGVLQPLLVRKTGQTYQIIAGERRWRAAKLAGLTEIPVIEREFEDSAAAEVALIENLQREDLNPVEEALAYRSLINDYHLTQEEVADRVSKNRSTVTNSLRLLQLGDELLTYVSDGRLSAGHARALLSVAEPARRKEMADRIVNLGLSVREAEKMTKTEKQPAEKRKKEEDVYAKEAARQLSRCLGTKVSIRPGKDGAGKIEIEYYSTDELNGLIGRLK